jgi:hypothetical protein
MLLWQPQNSLRVRSVFFVSLVLHVLVCFALLFVYKDYHQRLVIDLSSRIPSNAIVKLLPLSASRLSSQVLGVKGGGKSGKKGVQKSGKKTQASLVSKQKKKKSPTSLVKQVVTSKSAKAQKGKKEAAQKAKTLMQEKKKKAGEELQKKKEAEKLAQSSVAKAKEDREASSSVKTSEDKKEVAEKEKQKIIEPEVREPLKQEVVESVQAPATDQSISEGMGGSTVGPEGQEILYLTQQEFDALQIQQKLQECLFDLWTPPAGIPSGALCEVLITVGWDGAILETQFLKKTDILMYDLSVQETLEQVAFPHEVWGKQITIAFKP